MRNVFLYIFTLLIVLSVTESQVIYIDSSNFNFDVEIDIAHAGTSSMYIHYSSWLSSDALQIYYNGMILEPSTIFFNAERTSLSEDFRYSSMSSFQNCDFPWLSNDELNIFYIKEQKLYHSDRENQDSQFTNKTVVQLNGISGYIYNPSFSDDLSQLYICVAKDQISSIKILEKLEDNIYGIKDSIKLSFNKTIGSGQLSKDGLKYYLSLIDTSGEYIYYLKRTNKNEKFDSLTYIKNNIINDSSFYNSQPSVSENNKFMALARIPKIDLLVYRSYLVIAFNSTTGYFENNRNIDYEEIYFSPNPASDYIEIHLPDNRRVNPTDEGIRIYNAIGECVMNLTPALSEGEGARIDISQLAAGVYFVRVGDWAVSFLKM